LGMKKCLLHMQLVFLWTFYLNKYYQNAHSLLYLAKILGEMTYLHSSRELLLCLTIKITEHVILSTTYLAQRIQTKTERYNTEKTAASY
jgi:hypothetical protein